MASRTMVAEYVADALLAGKNRQQVVAETAAWLKENGKARQASYLTQDVARILADKGYVFVRFTTAHPVDTDTKATLKQYVAAQSGAKTVECEFIIDTKLIGGVLIEMPYGTLDASVKARLAKIVEGAYA